MSQPSSRQALYDRIRKSSKDSVIVEEMIRLGFWPAAGIMPEDSADEIRRRAELEAQLRALRTEQTRLHNIEALKREVRKRRMAEARERRKETKARKLAERQARAETWKAKQETDIGFLGEGVSAGLGHKGCDAERLAEHGLPELADAAAVAAAMGIDLGTLRFLAYARTTSRVSHYVHFFIPKRTGGKRAISAPMPKLKHAQHWILANVLDPIALDEHAHGFRHGRSILTNAQPHLGSRVVVNCDLQNFFPTVSYRRTKGLFQSLGYGEQVASIFGLICTAPETQEVELDGQRYFVALGDRILPQGSPASPAITNLICRGLDRALEKTARQLGFRYTRYADDLSFSSDDANADVGRLLGQVRWLVQRHGFVVHPDKTRVLRQSRRQEVTGIVVNERPAVPRETLRRFRATLFQIEKDGPAGKRWGRATGDNGVDLMAAIEGFANYVAMVDPAKGRPLKAQVAALIARYPKQATPFKGRRRPSQSTDSPASEPKRDATAPEVVDDMKKKKNWWKLF